MEQVEVTKTDVEKKVERILKLIKRRNRAKKEPELVALVEDFHKHYQSLRTQYDHLIRESGKKAPDGKGNESCSYYASSSDSEYYSSEDIEINAAIYNKRGSHKRLVSNTEEELKRAYLEVADLKQQLASKTEEKEALASDHLAVLSKLQEIETINGDVRKEVNEKEKRLSALRKAHKGRVTELEEQLTGLKAELESLQRQKGVFEAQLDGMTAETKQQGEKNKALHVQISEKGDEVKKLMKQIKDNENNLTSKIEDLMAHVSNLKKEVDYLRARKCEAEAEGSIACKTNESFDQADIMKQELGSLHSQKMELEILLERKSKEISQYLIEVKTLKEELARKSAGEQIMAEEKKCLQVQLMDLESEVDALRKQKNNTEDEERSNNSKINQLREEKSHLNARILELEALFRERGLDLSALEEDGKSKRIKETAQITTLNTKVELLQQKLDSMKMEKSKLELQIADQQRIMKEREESTNKSMESNSKLARRLSVGSNLNYHALERKMEDLAQEFRKKTEDNIRLLYQRITVAEKIHYENKEVYKKIKERLEQENEALQQKLATSEAEFRKLRDTMEPGKNASTGLDSMVKRLEQENEALQQKLATCEAEFQELTKPGKSASTGLDSMVNRLEQEKKALQQKLATCEAEGREWKDTMEPGKSAGSDSMVNKLEDDGNSLTHVFAAELVSTNDSDSGMENGMKQQLKSNVDQVVAEVDKENEELLREKVMNLEAKLSQEGEEKLNLLKALSELENRVGELEKMKKEMDETLLCREEEKREAIRQLCLLIDYHRGRCDYLKELILNLTVRSKKKT